MKAWGRWLQDRWLALWFIGGLTVLIAGAVLRLGDCKAVLEITIQPLVYLSGGLMGVQKIASTWSSNISTKYGVGDGE